MGHDLTKYAVCQSFAMPSNPLVLFCCVQMRQVATLAWKVPGHKDAVFTQAHGGALHEPHLQSSHTYYLSNSSPQQYHRPSAWSARLVLNLMCPSRSVRHSP